MKDFLLPLISARIVYLEVLLNFRKSGKEDSEKFSFRDTVGTHLCWYYSVRLSVCSCVQRKVPPVLFYTSTLEYFSTTTHTQIYGEFTHILLRNLEHTENSYRFFSSDLEFEKLILNFTRHLFKELCHAPGILTQICAWAVEIIHLFLAGSWIYRWGYRGWSYSELYFTYSTRSVSFTKWWTKNTNDFNSLRPKFYYSKM
jgi:hypothetical protein